MLVRPALGGTRDASASDPTALPGVWALGVGKGQPRRLPAPASASGTRSLRRDGTADPRGGCHRNPPLGRHARKVLTRGDLGPASVSLAEGWGFQIARRVPAAIPPEAAGTERACRGGVSLARCHANSEGPRRGTSLLGRSRRSLGAQRVPPAAGRASAEGPRTCRAKQKPSRSDMGETTRGAKENSTEWKKRAPPRSRGTTSPATQWSGKAALELRLELPYFTPSNSTSKISVALGGISPG